MKIIKSVVIGCLLASSTVFATKTISEAEIEKIKAIKMLSVPGIELTGFLENESSYQVKGFMNSQQGKSPFDAFVTKDLKEIIFGKGFTIETKEPLLIPTDTSSFKDVAAYSYGTGKDEYFIFTDPECPFCSKLELLLPYLKDKGTFHIFLNPLNFHENAKQMSFHIMSKDAPEEKAKAMHKIAQGDTAYKDTKFSLNEVEQYSKLLKEQMEIGNRLGVTGTPAVFDKDGHSVVWMKLLDKYNIKKPVDMDGVLFLKKSNLAIQIHKVEGSDPIHLFVSLEDDESRSKAKKLINKYKNKSTINMYLKLDRTMKNIDMIKAIYSQKSLEEQKVVFLQVLGGHGLSESMIHAMKNMSKDEETKYLPVAYTMQKMGMNIKSSVLLIDNKGNPLD